MEILSSPIDEAHLEEAFGEIERWRIGLPPWGLGASLHCTLGHEHYVGSSANGQVWAFAVEERSLTENLARRQSSDLLTKRKIELLLIDSPVRDRCAISELLFRMHLARRENGRLGRGRIAEIVAAMGFPGRRTVPDFLPGAPESWCDLRVRLTHRFDRSEEQYITEELWNAYRSDSLEDALGKVFAGTETGVLVDYELSTTDVVPPLEWTVDWPLLRRGEDPPERRGRLPESLPWPIQISPVLLRLYQLPLPSDCRAPFGHYRNPTVRLQVGGRTAEEAVANWRRCAGILRRAKRGLVIPDGSPLDW